MRVLLAGGGTAGHVYPALSMIDKIKAHHPGAQFLYVGTKDGLEADIVPKADIPFRAIQVSGLKRKMSLENLKTVWRFLRAVGECKAIIKQFRPDVVLGTGGYVSAPVVYAASRLKVPALIHEQNVEPGLANTFLSRYVSAVAVSFEDSVRYFRHEKIVVTGNPRAQEVANANGEKGRQRLGVPTGKTMILVVGGSRGAEAINRAFVQMAKRIKDRTDCYFVYITGKGHFDTIKSELEEVVAETDNLQVYPFIYDLPDVLAGTDLIVSRAGATFLAEITALGIPSILIPSPYVTNNHQEKNARWLEREGASRVILEKDLTGDLLWKTITGIIDNPSLRVTMEKASKRLGNPEAQNKLYALMLELIR